VPARAPRLEAGNDRDDNDGRADDQPAVALQQLLGAIGA